MKYIIYLISIILLLGINLGLFNNLQIRGQIPNLLFLLALCYSVEKKDYDFFFISFISGLFLDFYSTGFFGGFTLAILAMSLCAHLFSSSIAALDINWKYMSAALAVAFLLFELVLWVYGFVAFKFNWTAEYSGFKIMMAGFLPGLFYNSLLLYPVYVFTIFLRRSVESLNVRSRGVIK